MTLSILQRAALGAAVAKFNAPHVQLWCEQNDSSIEPFNKLQTKLQSYLRAELKSLDNLHRFFDEFYQWRQEQPLNDTLNDRIADLACAALYSATEGMFDPECDDTDLILQTLNSLYDEMDELGADTSDLRQYWLELQNELSELVTSSSQRPLSKDWFRWLSDTTVSPFGMEE